MRIRSLVFVRFNDIINAAYKKMIREIQSKSFAQSVDPATLLDDRKISTYSNRGTPTHDNPFIYYG